MPKQKIGKNTIAFLETCSFSKKLSTLLFWKVLQEFSFLENEIWNFDLQIEIHFFFIKKNVNAYLDFENIIQEASVK